MTAGAQPLVDNVIWWNNFLAGESAVDLVGRPASVFERPKPHGGNYWKAHEGDCHDADGDEICDTPFGFLGNRDELPRVEPIPWRNRPELCLQSDLGLLEEEPEESLGLLIDEVAQAILEGDANPLARWFSADVIFDMGPERVRGKAPVAERLEAAWRCHPAEARLEIEEASITDPAQETVGAIPLRLRVQGCGASTIDMHVETEGAPSIGRITLAPSTLQQE